MIAWRHPPAARESTWSDFGLPGIFVFLSVVALLALVTMLVAAIRPPTVEELERDIWADWARYATDSQGRTLVDQLLDHRQPAGRQLVTNLGNLIANFGDQFVVRTAVRYLRIRDRTGAVFANWELPTADADDLGWKDLVLDLKDPNDFRVGTLEVAYRFYGGGLESLPNIRRLQGLYRAALWLAGVLALVSLMAIIANILRLRERAKRVQSQQVTLDLAHQMCHELRNGLWAFSLESKNLRQLFQLVDDYFRVAPRAMEAAANRLAIEPGRWERFQRLLTKELAASQVDPQTDLLPTNDMARQAEAQIESFARYINLTVEELDRYLLGTAGPWEAVRLRLRDVWFEACELLRLRFRSAGVETCDDFQTDDDWIEADRRALVHAFVNLAKNAIEAMRDRPAPRRIIFQVTADDATVHCSLTNSGAPIAPAHLPRVFESGFTTKQGAGRGTGLTIVRESMLRMGGTITVTSSQEGGTCFQLQFPRAVTAGIAGER